MYRSFLDVPRIPLKLVLFYRLKKIYLRVFFQDEVRGVSGHGHPRRQGPEGAQLGPRGLQKRGNLNPGKKNAL